MTATNKKLKKETKSQQKTNLLIETICKCTFALFFFTFQKPFLLFFLFFVLLSFFYYFFFFLLVF